MEADPEVPVGYISTTNQFKSTIEKFADEIGGVFKVISEENYSPNVHNRSVEYVFVEGIKDLKSPYTLAYNVLESTGLVVFIEKQGFDIWKISEEFMDNYLSEATYIDIDNGYSLITSKKLLRS